ncbi:MAG: hypothetical protein WA463_18930, partial [Terriglobales bacterium]
IAYLLTCVLFKRAYAGYGMAADSVRRKENGTVTRMLLKTTVTVFNRYYREKRMRLRLAVMPTKAPAGNLIPELRSLAPQDPPDV